MIWAALHTIAQYTGLAFAAAFFVALFERNPTNNERK